MHAVSFEIIGNLLAGRSRNGSTLDGQHGDEFRLPQQRHRERVRPCLLRAAIPRYQDIVAETLRRLEEEERQFKEFLDRLRQAKDKAEFDQFMSEMRRRSEGPAPQPMS